jgi:signal transduction histidine kinase
MSDTSIDFAKENDELKREIAAKSDLISVSAHQLRTSLTSMKWILKMFVDGDFGALNAEQKNFIEKAMESDERMLRLVNEMLSINHAEDTLDTMHTEALDVVKLLEEVNFDFTGESYKRGIELIFLKPTLAISPVLADLEKIRVVFQNLIENAIKYSNTGGRVFVNASEKADSIEISVRDTGIGILDADQSHIFGKFFRADNAKKQDVVGSGLGLFTTARIVEKHHGKIWFESTAGEGTTFFVDIPSSQTNTK